MSGKMILCIGGPRDGEMVEDYGDVYETYGDCIGTGIGIVFEDNNEDQVTEARAVK